MRIRTKYLLILVSLAATLTAAVSIYQFSATSRVTGEFQNRSLQRLETALLEAAQAHALTLSTLTADSLLEPLFFEDLDAVGNIVESLLAKDQIIFANVYDADGRVFHNGSDKLETFGNTAPPEVLEILGESTTSVDMQDNKTIRIIQPIAADGYVFGVLDVLIDTLFVESQIAMMRTELIATAERELEQQVRQLILVSLLVLLLAGLVATILAARLSAPIQDLANATDRISRGDFSVDIAMRRTDELGSLAHSFDDMSRALRETMVSRSELQKTVEDQTRELRQTHEKLLAVESDRREVLDEIGEDLEQPISDLEHDAEHALRNQDSALELRHSMSQLLLRIRDIRRLLDDLRFASRSDEPRKAARR